MTAVLTMGGPFLTTILLAVSPVQGEATGPRAIWPTYRGNPQRTGQSPFRGSARMRVKWEVDLGHEVCCSPSVAHDGTIYVGAGAVLYALTPEGQVLWRQDFVASGHCRTDGSANGTRQAFTSPTPALAPDGTIYLACGLHGQGIVVALDPCLEAEKRIQWAFKTGNEMRGAPLLVAQTCFVGNREERMVLALDTTGKPNWQPSKRSLYGVTSSPALSHDGTTLYIGGFDGRLHALDAQTGQCKWSAGPDRRSGIRLPEKDAHGKLSRRFTTAGHIPEAPAIGPDKTIYFGSWDGHLYAASPAGEIRWSMDLKDRVTSAPAVGTDGHVLVSTFDGALCCIRVSDGNPVIDWQVNANARYSSPMLSADGRVYVGTLDGKLSAYALADGHEVGEVALEGWIYASPVPGGDGVLYIGASDGRFRAIH